jgi:hypothetical protein
MTVLPFLPVPFLIEGDGSATSVSYTLTFTPTVVVLVSATKENPLGAVYGSVDVSSNISSIMLAGNVITFNFVAAFTGNIVVAVDFNTPLGGGVGAGTGQLVNQGAQGTIAASWFTELTDGASVLGVSANPLYVQGAISNFPATSVFVGTVPSTAPANTALVGSIYNATAPVAATGKVMPLQSNSNGALYVEATSREYTYRACQSAFTPLADVAIPFFVIQGSASATVKIRHIKITWACTTGNAAPNVIRLRRYTVISGGTPAAVTPVPDDTTNPSATAVVSQYTVLPTTGTPYNAGATSSEYMQWITNAAGLVGPVAVQWEFGVNGCQPIVLRGTSEFAGIEISAVAAGGPLMTVRVSWTEE